jgi:Mrp family chromosome partitioning ATPase
VIHEVQGGPVFLLSADGEHQVTGPDQVGRGVPTARAGRAEGARVRGARSAARPPAPHPLAEQGGPPPFAPGRWAPEDVLAGCRPVLRRWGTPDGGPIGVTSASRGEGRSTVAAGAADVLHIEHGQSTVLLELDLDRPSMASTFEVRDHPGLGELVRGEAALTECITWAQPRLGVLPAGSVHDVVDVLTRFRRSEVLSDLQRAGHAVVADLPPLWPHGTADRVVDLFPRLMLVVKAGSTALPALRSAVSTLDTTPAVVLNQKHSAVPRWLRRPLGL